MTDAIGYKSKKQKVGIIIQARMTSTRFPGKSMALLCGKPVLQHVIEKAMMIRPRDIVIVAVPDTEASEPMLKLVDQMNTDGKLTNFCGSETDVLDRYYNAARKFQLDVIMRITADCPFLVPKVCSEVLQLFLWRKLDYCSNVHPVRSYPKGLDCEAFSMDALEAAYQLGTEPYDREHVTPWMQREKQLKKACVQQQIDASHLDWCVDVPGDIARLEEIAKFKDKMEASNDK